MPRPPAVRSGRRVGATEVAEEILGVIRRQFYSDAEPKRFHQDRRLLLSWVVLWPASWLAERGVSLSAGRYKAIMLSVLDDAGRHRQASGKIYWPRYLATCIQSHFRHQGEAYYDEGKVARETSQAVMLGLARPGRAPGPAQDTTERLAELRSILAVKRPCKAQRALPTKAQLTLGF